MDLWQCHLKDADLLLGGHGPAYQYESSQPECIYHLQLILLQTEGNRNKRSQYRTCVATAKRPRHFSLLLLDKKMSFDSGLTSRAGKAQRPKLSEGPLGSVARQSEHFSLPTKTCIGTLVCLLLNMYSCSLLLSQPTGKLLSVKTESTINWQQASRFSNRSLFHRPQGSNPESSAHQVNALLMS